LADCRHPASAPKPALRLKGQELDSVQQRRSLSWHPHNIENPGTKANWVGQKPPLKPKDIWAIRIQLQNAHQFRDLAMFNLAIDSKLRGCDLVNLRVRDITHGNQILGRAMVVQRKTQRAVQFELTEPTRAAVATWIEKAKLKPEQCLFPSRLVDSPHVSTRQYARIVHQGVSAIGLDSTAYGTHTMRRTKATLIYKRTKNLRAVQVLLGHTKLESTVRRSRNRLKSSNWCAGRTPGSSTGLVRPLSGVAPYA
jgi:integrase